MFEPAVKWSGSKRSQAAEIVRRIPSGIDTYYEPFCGGCSILYRMLSDCPQKARRYVCSDLNGDLISLWNTIRDNPKRLIDDYDAMWHEMNCESRDNAEVSSSIESRKRYFEKVRDEFNQSRNPSLFLFIMRTCTNGMPRYNKSGAFNNSFHVTRKGIEPLRLARILRNWSELLRKHRVEFVCRSYEDVWAGEDDFIYCDPPYAGTKGMYFGGIDLYSFFGWLGRQTARWALSFDGKAGISDLTYDVPESLYKTHEYLRNGNSSFRRVIGKDRHADVYESLYCNYKLPEEATLKVQDLFSC